MLFHRRSLALVGPLIALLTTLAIQPATAAAQLQQCARCEIR